MIHLHYLLSLIFVIILLQTNQVRSDQIINNINQNENNQKQIKNENNGKQNRRLQAQQMRIKFDNTFFLSNTIINSQLSSQITNIFQTAILFYEDLLIIKQPQINSITIPADSIACNSYKYTSSQKSNGFLDTDLQILAYYEIDTDLQNQFETNSFICEQDSTEKRPTIGELGISIKDGSSTLSDYEYNQLLKQVIHEMMHILAMNVQLINYFKDSTNSFYNPLPIDIPLQYMYFPNTLLWAQTYYDCSTLTEIPIEISSSGKIHWNRVILLDDIMSGLFTLGEGLWSGINNALLKDTGWYSVKEDIVDNQINWGKGKKCDFVLQSCGGSGYFSEFCTSNKSQGLTFSQNGLGQCQQFYASTSDQYSKAPDNYKGCMFNIPVANRQCQNVDNMSLSQNKDLVTDLKYSFSYYSRAFQSSLTPMLILEYSSFACYQAVCASNHSSISITVGNQILSCVNEGELITPIKTFVYQGNLKCPANFTEFCSSPQSCPNYCSSNGYCLNSKCYCQTGYSGDGCECSLGLYYKNGSCQSCPAACKTCDSLNITQCLDCEDTYYFLNGLCYQCGLTCLECDANTPSQCTKCAEGYFLDSTTQTCIQCIDNCYYCTNSSTCITCQDGYGLDSKNTCSVTCDYNCKKCNSSPFSCVECISPMVLNTTTLSCSCSDYLYEDQYGACQDCKENCITCTTKNNCTKCKDGYSLSKITQSCQPQGSSSLIHIICISTLILLFLQI